MVKKPLYIELLHHLKDTRQTDEWMNITDAYADKLKDEDFYNNFREEVMFLSDQGDIIVKSNLNENPQASALQVFAQITEDGEIYLSSYKYALEDERDKYSTNQIILFMAGIVGCTILVGYLLTYFFS